MSALAILFWLSVFGVFYSYAGYPILIGLLARLFPKPVSKAPNTLSVTVVISVYNEAVGLPVKLRNIRSCVGSDRINQILIGSDGSTDHPEQAIHDLFDSRIKLIAFPERRGKPTILNDLVPLATGDILVMMDVRQRLDDNVLPALLDNFSDPAVGVVSGELVFERSESDSSAAEGIDAYWRYEKWIRDRESRFDSVPGATGAIYAIRRELVKPIPAEAALDDVLIPMNAINLGYRCIFEPRAKIYDRPAQNPAQEAVRKRRTLAGCVQLLKYHPAWCLPFGHPIWWQFGSHKIARLFSPFLMAGALLICIPLAFNNLLYTFLLIGQTLFYALGLLGHPRVIQLFLHMQVALLMAWRDGLGQNNLAKWRKVEG